MKWKAITVIPPLDQTSNKTEAKYIHLKCCLLQEGQGCRCAVSALPLCNDMSPLCIFHRWAEKIQEYIILAMQFGKFQFSLHSLVHFHIETANMSCLHVANIQLRWTMYVLRFSESLGHTGDSIWSPVSFTWTVNGLISNTQIIHIVAHVICILTQGPHNICLLTLPALSKFTSNALRLALSAQISSSGITSLQGFGRHEYIPFMIHQSPKTAIKGAVTREVNDKLQILC